MSKAFALVDCNNFYASCERVFDPSLRGQPIIVLSGGDGCVIARSNEAKELGVGMGVPFFKCRDLVSRFGIRVFSSNFVLYGDMSRRVMSVLAEISAELEIYSIDEAFVALHGLKAEDFVEQAEYIRSKVGGGTGIPVSVGVASTKTLAKLATRIAKKAYSKQGVFYLQSDSDVDYWLEKTPVEDIWGIGRKKVELLRGYGIVNALQLKNAPDQWVKDELSVVSLRTVWELRGISCLELAEAPVDKKSISTSRTFAHDVSDLELLHEAVASYVANAAENLREQGAVCGYLQVYIQTNRFKKGPYYANMAGTDLTPPTAFTPQLIAAARGLLGKIYRPEFAYKSAGVVLAGLQSQEASQQFLFDEVYQDSRRQKLMEAMDSINRGANSGKVFLASEGLAEHVSGQSHCSRRFTTRWDELLEIRI